METSLLLLLAKARAGEHHSFYQRDVTKNKLLLPV
jgi:hypothetical protein